MRQIKYKGYEWDESLEKMRDDSDFIQDGYLVQFVNNENSVFGLVEKPDGTLELIEHYRIKFCFPFAERDAKEKSFEDICKKYDVKGDRF